MTVKNSLGQGIGCFNGGKVIIGEKKLKWIGMRAWKWPDEGAYI